MPAFNKVILCGHLTRDPELQHLPNGTALCRIGLATNHVWYDKEGTKKEEVCFVDCTAFGKQAETLNQYMAKGAALLVEGRLRYETWEDKDGNKRSRHSIAVDRFVFLGGKRDEDERRPARSAGASNRTTEESDDGIPF